MEPAYPIPPRGQITESERIKIWQRILADQESSGLKMTKFCQKHQLLLSTFKQRKYQLQKEPEQIEGIKDGNPSFASKFIPLQIENNSSVIKENNTAAKTEIKIVFKNGHAITLAEICKEMLVTIITQISELPC